MSDKAACVNCRFGKTAQRIWPAWPGGLWTKSTPETKEDIVLCRFNPREIVKQPDHWCGQHQPKGLAKDSAE